MLKSRYCLPLLSPVYLADNFSVAVAIFTRKLGVMRSQEGFFDGELVNVPELMNNPQKRTGSRKVGKTILLKLKEKTKVRACILLSLAVTKYHKHRNLK